MLQSLAIGITTAPRENDPAGPYTAYLPQTLQSLRTVPQFQKGVHIQADPCSECGFAGVLATEWVAGFGWTTNPETLGCYGNWKQLLANLLTTEKDWLLLLQDDVVFSSRIGEVLEPHIVRAAEAYKVGCLSLYTSPAMVDPADREADGFVPAALHQHSFWGALALLFPREAAEALLNADRFANHPKRERLDVVIGHTIKDLGLEILVHVPSLCDHAGAISTLGRHKIKGIQAGRRGYRFQE